MAEQSSKLSGLWRELRRRHVVRAALAYAAAAFVVLQMGEIILPAFVEDTLWLRLIVVLAALGFPLVIVLAWVYEITPQGIRRMTEIDAEAGHLAELLPVFPRIALLVVTIITVGVAGWWAVMDTLEKRRALASQPPGAPSLIRPAEYNPDEPVRSLAVLPLEIFSESGERDYFGPSLHQALVNQLSQLPGVRVVSRTSVLQYAGTTKTMPQIGDELGVDAVIEGTVLVDGDAVQVTVELIHASSDTQVWSNVYPGRSDNLITLQNEVALAIATEIQDELLPEEQQTLLTYRRPSNVPMANEELMKAEIELDKGTEQGRRAAEEHLHRAIEADPDFGEAYGEMARVKLEAGLLEFQEDSAALSALLPSVRSLVETAVTLGTPSPEVQDLMVFVRSLTPADVEVEEGEPVIPAPRSTAAVAEGGVRVSVSDGNVEMDVWNEGMWTSVGRRLEALWASSRFSGEGAGAAVHRAMVVHQNGETDRAIAMLRGVIRDQPTASVAWDDLERILAGRGDWNGVVALLRERAQRTDLDMSDVDGLEEDILDEGAEGYWGWKTERLEEQLDHGEPVSYVDVAIGHVQMGDYEEAIGYLVEAAEKRDPRLVRELGNPALDPIRRDPRFRKLVRGMSNRVQRPRPPRDRRRPGG